MVQVCIVSLFKVQGPLWKKHRHSSQSAIWVRPSSEPMGYVQGHIHPNDYLLYDVGHEMHQTIILYPFAKYLPHTLSETETLPFLGVASPNKNCALLRNFATQNSALFWPALPFFISRIFTIRKTLLTLWTPRSWYSCTRLGTSWISLAHLSTTSSRWAFVMPKCLSLVRPSRPLFMHIKWSSTMYPAFEVKDLSLGLCVCSVSSTSVEGFSWNLDPMFIKKLESRTVIATKGQLHWVHSGLLFNAVLHIETLATQNDFQTTLLL